MSDSLKTSLSALVDGEASTEESSHVLKQLADDEDMRKEWENYHTIASVLRNEKVSILQTPTDWDALAEAHPVSRDVLAFQPRNRVKSMLIHGGIGAGLAACIMAAMFFMFSIDRSTPDPSLALSNATGGTTSDSLPLDNPSFPQLSFGGTFEFSVSIVPPEIQEDLRQMMLDALIAHDISRSGIDRSLMHDASVISRNVSQEL